ncbi:antifreeze protein [Magnetospirillum sp. ME-1]|uniref:antifreeze protein n=1 Tax=Magnetospirillum sp. ME-1 TaxID=1639348 RepID=UPI000A17F25A|nr:antifreeze protein [Magnetospirillum sp. ME-1]ARJ66928.1 antifreeze protein [Magnetospirillum sp. ME-1]
MPASRAKALALALGTVLLAPAALAQQPGKPLILTSPNLEAPPPAEAPKAEALPAPHSTTSTATEFPGGPAKPGPRFEVEELKAPDPDSVGALDESHGGLGMGMWHGTSAALVRKILPALPAAPGSRAAHSLSRRLLLSAAAAPEGNRGQTPSLLELRAERLFAMGEIEGLASLLKAAPASLASPGLSRLKVDTFLLAGDAKSACAEAAVLAQGAPLDARLSVFCQLSAGKTLEAGMALDLMRERKDADHAFIAAAEVMGGTPPAKVDKLPNPTPLHLAAFKAAKLPLPADTVANAPPSMLRAIADNPGMAADHRITAAERAEALGILDTESLRKLMAEVTLTPAEQQAAATQGDKSPRGRVLWLRATGAEQVATVRAELITRILMAAAERHAFAATARLYAPLIAELKPAPDLAGAAPMLARALYAVGRSEAAGNWLALAKTDPAAAKLAAGLWPLARIARVGLDSSPAESFAAWLEGSQPNERRTVVTLSMLQAVGEPIPASAWITHATGTITGTGPKPALKALLRAAAEGARRGETALLSVAALGEGGLESADPDTLNRVVVFLRQAGFEREARELALEAVLANGG